MLARAENCDIRPEQPNNSILYTGTSHVKRILSYSNSRAVLLEILNQEIIACARCRPLAPSFCGNCATKTPRLSRPDLLGTPVPSFGDPAARVLILGLAPGAHGSNRTGRMFTGDRSGDILYRVLHKTGFASQPVSRSREDGLELHDLYITAAAHCAPPGNKPTPEELRNCRPLLRARTGAAAQCEGGGGAGQDRLRHLPGYAEIPRRDRQPRALRLRPRRAIPHRRRGSRC